MEISVRNYGGCKTISLSFEGVALIAGHNASGKTSVASAVAAALTGDPVLGGYKKDAAMFVMDGEKTARVEVQDAGGKVSIEWPSCECVSEGVPPTASRIAVGIDSFISMSIKDRSELVSGLIGSYPRKEDVAKELPFLCEKDMDRLWSVISSAGWDGAEEQQKTKGANLKASWKSITGEQYGIKKAENWLPAAWTVDLEDVTINDLNADVERCQGEVVKAGDKKAVDEAKKIELEALVASLPKHATDIAEIDKVIADTESGLEKMRARFAEIPTESGLFSCPHCENPIQFVAGRVEKAVRISDDQKKESEKLVTDISATVTSIARMKNERKDVEYKIAAAESAKKTLADTVSAQVINFEAIQERLSIAIKRLKAKQSKDDADRAHFSILAMAEVVKTLQPDGLRRKMLIASLRALNLQLEGLCKNAGWGTVTVDENMQASYNGRPVLLSESERFRVKTILQIWIAKADKSSLVIIDGADVLVDKNLRNGLFSLLRAEKTKALVCMALPDKEAMPDLAKAGLGTSCWMG